MARHGVDGILVQWGDRLFYPGNRIIKPAPAPRLHDSIENRAAAIRGRIRATVVRQAPQAFIKIRGVCRGVQALSAHFNYLSRGGELAIEDDRGVRLTGKEGVRDLVDQWRYAGSLINLVSTRKEAVAMVLSSPAGTDPQRVLEAARAFAHSELNAHRYVMVLHQDRPNPHVHLTVRKRSMTGQPLPNWTHGEHWRRQYASELRALGVEVEATRQAVRGENRNYEALWQVKAKARGDLIKPGTEQKASTQHVRTRAEAMECWAHIMEALSRSEIPGDRQLADQIAAFVRDSPFYREMVHDQQRPPHALAREMNDPSMQMGRERSSLDREISR